ncbi:MAG: dihydropteroate synthase [Pseudomonadota bacterium]|nr:dihydropteroate synthase [Pseudomonadota bacterium]
MSYWYWLKADEMTQGFSPPQVMGILNVTPDSFSDGGRYVRRDLALRRAEQMVAEGADIIDVGAESTRPGAQPVAESDEIERAAAVVEAITDCLDVVVSIDTSKPAVMMAAVAAGATMINDVRALREDGALTVAAQTGVKVCLMHMQGEPRVMQAAPVYNDVVEDVLSFLRLRIDACLAAGIPLERLLIDPGFGFGKTLDHNLTLLSELHRFKALGVPLLVGLSRKSFIGTVVGKPVHERLPSSLAAATLALWHGASIIRVHDVAETVDVMKLCCAVQNIGCDRA